MTKKALLVGSSFSAAPLLFALKKRGIHVGVCGSKLNDPCHQHADSSHFFDYSNRESLLEVVKSEQVDYIIPSCNDPSYMSCAWVAEQCGYPGFDPYDVATILHNKRDFRNFMSKHSLPVPRSFWVKAGQSVKAHNLDYPLLVKPVDCSGGRGVTKVSSSNELPEAIDKAYKHSFTAEAIVEEFVEGSLHSHTAFIKNTEIIFDTFVDEFCTINSYQVNCSNHPSFVPNNVRNSIRSVMNKLIKTLTLSDGLLHTQFILKDDQFIIVECMRRCPGDLYGLLVELSTGINYIDLVLRPYVNEDISLDYNRNHEKLYGRHTVSSKHEIVPYGFSHNIVAKDVMIVPLKTSGELMLAAPYDKLAIIFTEFNNIIDMRDITPHLDRLVSIKSLKEIEL